jgi:DNA-binding CsgD family transcriptional regulator
VLSNLTTDFMAALAEAKTQADIWRLAGSLYSDLGFSHTIYTYTDRRHPARTQVWTNMPGAWQSRYIEKELYKVDPFFTYCCRTFQPIGTGPAFIDDYDYLTSAERQVIREGGETGFVSGFSSPVRLLGGSAFGGWNFGTQMPRREFEMFMSENGDSIRLAGFIVHEHLLRLSPPLSTNGVEPDLTERERECLLWLSRGLRTSAIADRLGIAVVTVDLHIKGARTKLNAATREEALAKAILSGQIIS